MQALSERLDTLLAGSTLRRADLLGFSSLKTYDPSPDALKGHRLESVGRRAKYLVWTFDDGTRVVLHLSQAGRLDVASLGRRAGLPGQQKILSQLNKSPCRRCFHLIPFLSHREPTAVMADASHEKP